MFCSHLCPYFFSSSSPSSRKKHRLVFLFFFSFVLAYCFPFCFFASINTVNPAADHSLALALALALSFLFSFFDVLIVTKCTQRRRRRKSLMFHIFNSFQIILTDVSYSLHTTTTALNNNILLCVIAHMHLIYMFDDLIFECCEYLCPQLS